MNVGEDMGGYCFAAEILRGKTLNPQSECKLELVLIICRRDMHL